MTKPQHKPTSEQEKVITSGRNGESIIIQALAGAGKTSTLKLLSKVLSGRGIYLAFNRSIALEAKKKFGKNVHCTTIHGLAYRDVGTHYADRVEGGDKGKLSPMRIARAFRYQSLGFLSPLGRASLVRDTLTNFQNSSSDVIDKSHAPGDQIDLLSLGRTLTPQDRHVIVETLVQDATKLWEVLQHPDCDLPVPHDFYLKLYALQRPTLPFDFLTLDEAQDANDLMLGLVKDQPCQKILVGDSHQQIYTFRGALNALDKVEGCTTCHLTQSFRFGSAIADKANLILGNLGAQKPMRGFDRDRSELPDTEAMLFRTNMGMFGELIKRSLNQRQECHVAGGTKDVVSLLNAVSQLAEGQETTHPDLMGFRSWKDYVKASEEDGAPRDMQQLVRIVNTYPVGALRVALSKGDRVKPEAAEIILTSAHKSKGREWPVVTLGRDFFVPSTDPNDEEEPFEPEEARLNYVAVTRAQKALYGGDEMLEKFEGRLRALAGQQKKAINMADVANKLRRMSLAEQKRQLALMSQSERAALAQHLQQGSS